MTMTYKELNETLCINELRRDGAAPKIYIENEIFDDIQKSYVDGSSKVAQIYAYYYLVKLLYRYALYGMNEDLVNVSTHKLILGYAKNYRGIDLIIKKGGVLNELGYTRHESNYPISWSLEDGIVGFGLVKDRMIDDNGKDHGFFLPDSIIKELKPNSKIHYPIKAFERNYNDIQNGSFIDISNTHGIEVETFLKCMSKKELGCEGFYLYSYIKCKNDWKGGHYWDIPIDQFIKDCGMKKTKFLEITKALEQYNMISIKHSPWVFDKPSHIKIKAGSYFAYPSVYFTNAIHPLSKPIKISWEQCQKKYSNLIIDYGDLDLDLKGDGEEEMVYEVEGLPF